jgi:hypothetical protein
LHPLGPGCRTTRPSNALLRRVIALDPPIDEAIGESATFRFHWPVLQAAVEGLFAALGGWSAVVARFARRPRVRALCCGIGREA